jgi:hypothetical protein
MEQNERDLELVVDTDVREKSEAFKQGAAL